MSARTNAVACALSALLATGAGVAATAAPGRAAPAPIVLPPPPAPVNATSSTLASAVLQIWQAQRVNPQAAQNAAFAYVQALQQYRSGNAAAARVDALRAWTLAGSAQVAPLVPATSAPALAPARGQIPGLAGGLYGADAPAIDADSFLALARGSLDACAAHGDRRGFAQRSYAVATSAFAAHDWEATRRAAKAAIDACAKPAH